MLEPQSAYHEYITKRTDSALGKSTHTQESNLPNNAHAREHAVFLSTLEKHFE